MRKYTDTAKVMEFWKQLDGSHLWITKDGILHDCYIKKEPMKYSCIAADESFESCQLSRQDGTIYLTTVQGIFPLGGIENWITEKKLADRFLMRKNKQV